MGSARRWTTCPGCGVELPANDWQAQQPGRTTECWELYGEVLAHEQAALSLVRDYHQLTVDAYAAQHPAGNRMGLVYGLVGLHLTLDRDIAGVDVRTMHQRMTDTVVHWPDLVPPATRGAVTVADVALASGVDAHADLVTRWAQDVWRAWADAHRAIATLTDDHLLPLMPSLLTHRRDGPPAG
ncbi:MAG TPA: DUF5946 family protein [Euzebyales bacterium]|nr:DUF5946 family protein [Euzebyales bacterium]